MIPTIFLVITACLNGNQGICEDFSVQTEYGSVKACQIIGQAPLAQWSGDHPGYLIKSYHCQDKHPAVDI